MCSAKLPPGDGGGKNKRNTQLAKLAGNRENKRGLRLSFDGEIVFPGGEATVEHVLSDPDVYQGDEARFSASALRETPLGLARLSSLASEKRKFFLLHNKLYFSSPVLPPRSTPVFFHRVVNTTDKTIKLWNGAKRNRLLQRFRVLASAATALQFVYNATTRDTLYYPAISGNKPTLKIRREILAMAPHRLFSRFLVLGFWLLCWGFNRFDYLTIGDLWCFGRKRTCAK